ncbi:50S ribosomal protein L24 [bacterium]|nr:50S ribosomal protein L24 [bacterium]
MKIQTGDIVKVIAGKEKGRDGIVMRIYPKQERVMVMGVNMYKRHVKKSEQYPQGGVVELPRALHVSNVMKMVAGDKKATTRIGYVVENGKKFRVEKKTGERIKTSKK